MPDDLYERDILEWSDRQSDLLGRLARGERVDDAIDWPNVIEEVLSVGLSELHNCEDFLRRGMFVALKLHLEPASAAVPLWRGEIVSCFGEAERRFAPSMRHRIDLDGLWHVALRQIAAELGTRSIGLPDACPFTLDDLLAPDADPMVLAAQIG